MVTTIIYKHLARAERNYLSINIDSTIFPFLHPKKGSSKTFIYLIQSYIHNLLPYLNNLQQIIYIIYYKPYFFILFYPNCLIMVTIFIYKHLARATIHFPLLLPDYGSCCASRSFVWQSAAVSFAVSKCPSQTSNFRFASFSFNE